MSIDDERKFANSKDRKWMLSCYTYNTYLYARYLNRTDLAM